MRISYWSSDVCSSDLQAAGRGACRLARAACAGRGVGYRRIRFHRSCRTARRPRAAHGRGGAVERADGDRRGARTRRPRCELEWKGGETGKGVSVSVNFGGRRNIKKKKKHNKKP